MYDIIYPIENRSKQRIEQTYKYFVLEILSDTLTIEHGRCFNNEPE